MKTQIQVVKDNKEKQITYAKQIGKYNLAMRYGFYLEAISIVYAMCEDRLKSFLYHSGCINRELKITKSYKKEIRVIWKLEDGKQLKLNNISSKYTYALNMLLWANETEATSNRFEELLKDKIIGELDIGALQELIGRLESWCDVRNEIIHGLLNKSMEAVEEKLKSCAEEGYLIARGLDEETRRYKSRNNIRKKLRIQG